MRAVNKQFVKIKSTRIQSMRETGSEQCGENQKKKRIESKSTNILILCVYNSLQSSPLFKYIRCSFVLCALCVVPRAVCVLSIPSCTYIYARCAFFYLHEYPPLICSLSFVSVRSFVRSFDRQKSMPRNKLHTD